MRHGSAGRSDLTLLFLRDVQEQKHKSRCLQVWILYEINTREPGF